MDEDTKDALSRYLRVGRAALLWKLAGVAEYDARRPVTPTGTDLLGLVEHMASVQSEYLGVVLGRPFPEELPWMAEGVDVDADMWALPHEDREGIVALYHRDLIVETHRHAGHADIVRELVDGAAGLRDGNDNLAHSGEKAWRAHHDRVEQAARAASGR